MEQPPTRILVGVPVGGGVVSHELTHSIMALKEHLIGLGWAMEFVTIPDGLVSRSRNAFASAACRDESVTHLLMLDADVTVPPEGIERLVRSGHDVCGSVVPLRAVRWEKARALLDGVPGASADQLRAIATEYAVWFAPGAKPVSGFLPVYAIGSAAMLISRSALLKISSSALVQYAESGLRASDGREDGWTFFDPYVDQAGIYLSEDYAFCDRWRSLGGTVWADLNTTTRHVGPVPVDGDIALTIATARSATRARLA